MPSKRDVLKLLDQDVFAAIATQSAPHEKRIGDLEKQRDAAERSAQEAIKDAVARAVKPFGGRVTGSGLAIRLSDEVRGTPYYSGIIATRRLGGIDKLDAKISAERDALKRVTKSIRTKAELIRRQIVLHGVTPAIVAAIESF